MPFAVRARSDRTAAATQLGFTGCGEVGILPAPVALDSTCMLCRFRRFLSKAPLALRFYTAFVLMVGTSGAAWLGFRIYRHESAIRLIERAGGTVVREPGGPAWTPGWLRSGWCGSAFESVRSVEISEQHV
jgi:hypothetical protein